MSIVDDTVCYTLSQVKVKAFDLKLSEKAVRAGFSREEIRINMLTRSSKEVFNLIVCLTNKYNEVYVSQDKIGKLCGLARETVNRIIKDLDDLGLISKMFRGVKKTCLYDLSPNLKLDFQLRKRLRGYIPGFKWFSPLLLVSLQIFGYNANKDKVTQSKALALYKLRTGKSVFGISGLLNSLPHNMRTKLLQTNKYAQIGKSECEMVQENSVKKNSCSEVGVFRDGEWFKSEEDYFKIRSHRRKIKKQAEERAQKRHEASVRESNKVESDFRKQKEALDNETVEKKIAAINSALSSPNMFTADIVKRLEKEIAEITNRTPGLK